MDFGKSKVIEALAWYNANLAFGPNIEEVAHAVHLSSTHLRRLFHKVWGTSPQAAFTHAQFERAKELMLDQVISLERIAEYSGFGSASAFSRAFKVEFGVSPKSYRSKLQAEHLATTAKVEVVVKK
jgi:transcriptional regulator GlxA family with amidase domain